MHLEAAHILQYTEDEFLQTLNWDLNPQNKNKSEEKAHVSDTEDGDQEEDIDDVEDKEDGEEYSDQDEEDFDQPETPENVNENELDDVKALEGFDPEESEVVEEDGPNDNTNPE